MSTVNIINYKPKYKSAFKSLNEEWIQKYFVMEDSDRNALNHPDEYILAKGGAILLAELENDIVGVCALIKMDGNPYDFELAKMAVSPLHHRKGIGYRLGLAIIEKAKERGAKKLYLESNTKLAPALKLYEKLGFTVVTGVDSPYARCNIQMEITVS